MRNVLPKVALWGPLIALMFFLGPIQDRINHWLPPTPQVVCAGEVEYLIFHSGVTPAYTVNGRLIPCINGPSGALFKVEPPHHRVAFSFYKERVYWWYVRPQQMEQN